MPRRAGPVTWPSQTSIAAALLAFVSLEAPGTGHDRRENRAVTEDRLATTGEALAEWRAAEHALDKATAGRKAAKQAAESARLAEEAAGATAEAARRALEAATAAEESARTTAAAAKATMQAANQDVVDTKATEVQATEGEAAAHRRYKEAADRAADRQR
jgi:hypothetical protein